MITPDEAAGWHKQMRCFSTMTCELLQLGDWLKERGCTQVAMESTGEYGRALVNILEADFEVMRVNARPIKAVPGRKSDIKDGQWIAELLQHGLLQASFIPPIEQRDLWDLVRHRSNFIRERGSLINRVQKVLEGANIKLATVASDGMGVSGRGMLKAIASDQQTPPARVALAKGWLRDKRDQLVQALTGRVRPQQRFILAELLCQIDSIDETIGHFNQDCRPFEQAVALLDTIAGVARQTAEMIVSEIGSDRSRFKSANHIAACAGLAPGNYESAGKRFSGRTRPGNRAVGAGLVQAAHAATRMKTYLAAPDRRLSARRGRKRAIVAVAHPLLVIAYPLIGRQEPYQELGASYFDPQRAEVSSKRLVKG